MKLSDEVLNWICDQLANQVEIETIIVFGSQPHGDTAEGSDLGVMILISKNPCSVEDIDRYRSLFSRALAEAKIRLDLMVQATSFFDFRKKIQGSIESIIDQEGRVIYSNKKISASQEDTKCHKTFKAVCFDAFGTLVKSNEHQSHPYRRLIPYFENRSVARRQIMTANESIRELALKFGQPELGEALDLELLSGLKNLQLFDDVQSAISTLKSKGFKIAICSNLAQAYGDTVKALLPNLDAYVFSYEIGSIKPDIKIYMKVVESLKIQAEEILFIGDSLNCDVYGPQKIGMTSIHLNRKSSMNLKQVLSEMVTFD